MHQNNWSMKRSIICLGLLMLMAASCSKSGLGADVPVNINDSELSHDRIILGDQLENPYSVENMKSAFAALYPTKAGTELNFTDYYVRFLPSNSEQLDRLREMGLSLVDHPVDYEVVRDGDWYMDPSLDEDQITWQYAVAPRGFVFPKDIRYEILQECFLADNSPATKAMADVDWDAVERLSYVQTGNELLYEEAFTKGGDSAVMPSGRIAIIDPNFNAGQPIGVAGVKVECNVFVKFASAYTDRDGYYKMSKGFKSNPRYRLVFSNEKGFTIGFNTILYKGSVSGFGKNSASGVNITVDGNSDRALFRRCVANNAAYDYIGICERMNILPPPSGICMWMFDNVDASSTVMLHHGTVLSGSSNIYMAIATMVIRVFAPDITLGTKNSTAYSQIYSTTIHELAHSSHFAKVGLDYWNKLIAYIGLTSLSGGDVYGDASRENSGYCALAEMWAYYMESKCYQARYGGSNPMLGSSYWFHPQTMSYLESRGFSSAQLFSALEQDVTDVETYKERLKDLFPSKTSAINQVFSRYE